MLREKKARKRAGVRAVHERASSNLLVSITQATKLLLPCRVPAVELDGATVSVEQERVHLDAQRRCKKERDLRNSKHRQRGKTRLPTYFFVGLPFTEPSMLLYTEGNGAMSASNPGRLE